MNKIKKMTKLTRQQNQDEYDQSDFMRDAEDFARAVIGTARIFMAGASLLVGLTIGSELYKAGEKLYNCYSHQTIEPVINTNQINCLEKKIK